MVAKIHKAINLSSSFRYLRKGDDESKAKWLDDSFGKGFEYQDKVEMMGLIASMNPDVRVRKPFVHFSLSFLHHENLEDDGMKDVMHRYLEEMGYGYCPYMAFRHFDRPHPHFHILTTRSDTDGVLVDSHYDYEKSKEVCRKLEEEFGLIRNTSDRNPRKTNHKIEHAEKFNYKTNFKDIQRRLDRILEKDIASFDEFKARCRDEGIDARFYEAGTRVIGVSYSIEAEAKKFRVRASKLGYAYQVPSLSIRFTACRTDRRDRLCSEVSDILDEDFRHRDQFCKELDRHGISMKETNGRITFSNDEITVDSIFLFSESYDRLQELLSRSNSNDMVQKEQEQRQRLAALDEVASVVEFVFMMGVCDWEELQDQLKVQGITLIRNGADSVLHNDEINEEFKLSEFDPDFQEKLLKYINGPLWAERLAMEEQEEKEAEEKERKEAEEERLALWQRVEEEQRLKKERDRWSSGLLSHDVPEERRRAEIRRGWEDIPDSLRNRDPNEERTRGRERGLSPGSGW
jgi:hypothetical protein